MNRNDGPSVLYLIDSLVAGGAERSLVEMAPGLLAHDIRLEVAVLQDRPGLGPELERLGVRVSCIGGDGRRTWLTRLVRRLRNHPPDLVHTTLFESDVIGRLAAALVGVPAVTTLATVPYGREHEKEVGIRRSRLLGAQLADTVTAQLARRFHAVSRATASACVERLHLDAALVDVIPRGRDRNRMGRPSADRRATVRRALGLDADSEMVLFVGRLEPAKGIEVLLDAWAAVTAIRRGARLVVAGREGRSSDAAMTLVESGGLESSVTFLGERRDVPDLLVASDLFVLPSYREGLPGAVLEAMAMRVPIVASDIPPVREAVPDKSYAILVPPGRPDLLADALDAALDDVPGARDRVERAESRFDDLFDIDKVAQSMGAFYRRALRW